MLVFFSTNDLVFIIFKSFSWEFNSHVLKTRGEKVTPKIFKGSSHTEPVSREPHDERIHNALVLSNIKLYLNGLESMYCRDSMFLLFLANRYRFFVDNILEATTEKYRHFTYFFKNGEVVPLDLEIAMFAYTRCLLL